MILKRDELNENKYFENIRFNYIRKNFGIFKEFIQKPTEILEIPKSISKIDIKKKPLIKNETKFDFLNKFKNLKIKREILNDNL
jgi:hypothetical protein